MRSISAGGLAKIAQTHGAEPVIILEVQWTDGGSVSRYGDIDLDSESVHGVIQSVSGLDNVITISGVTAGTSGESQQLSFVLADVDGSIKAIIDNNDIHKRPAWVYQWYRGTAFTDRFLLFKGQVSSPIEWHEGDRTINFDVINQIEDQEVGFSVEEGDFRFIKEDLIGKPWPLCFGTVVNLPGLRLKDPWGATLKTGFGIHDFTKEARLDQLKNMCCPLVFRGFHITNDRLFGLQTARAIFAPEPGCFCQRIAQIEQLEAAIVKEKSYEYDSIEILNGTLFPQYRLITLKICGAIVKGQFSGSDTFHVQQYIHPATGSLTVPPTIRWLGCGDTASGRFSADPGTYGEFASRDQVLFAPVICDDQEKDRTNLGWDYLATFPSADFFWAEPGCEVIYEGREEIPFIVNILPSTINRVSAWRRYDSGIRELVTVPRTYYTSRLVNFSAYTITEVVLTKPLSRYNEGWEDDVYVTLTSSVGPNTVDILEWIIGKYTSFTVDTVSFNAVRTKIDNYPSHFPLLEQRNVFEVLKEIAFQARCALYLRNDKFYIKYLSEEPTADITINESDVLPESLVIGHTATEDLVTKLTAIWQYDYSKSEPNKAIFRYNVKRYGVQAQEFDFYIYNIYALVAKSATFWLIRMANTWKRLKFTTPLTKLQAEVFDIANVTLTDFADTSVKCIIEQATYDSDAHKIAFDVWTPVRSGERTPYDFAWPAYIDSFKLFPTAEDVLSGVAGGSGPNVDVTPPSLHPLAPPTGFTASFKNYPVGLEGPTAADFQTEPWTIEQKRRQTMGERRPSDVGDLKPGVPMPGDGEPVDIPNQKNPLGEITLWQQQIQRQQDEDNADDVDQTIQNQLSLDQSQGYNQDETHDPMDDLPEEPPEDEECVSCIRYYYTTRVTSVYTNAELTESSNVEGVTGRRRTEYPTTFNILACYNSRDKVIEEYNRFNTIAIESWDAIVGQPFPVFASIIQLAPPGCNDVSADDADLLSWTRTGDGDQDQRFKDDFKAPDSHYHGDPDGGPLF